jgi:hypothetical protein
MLALVAAGLFLHGPARDIGLFPLLGVFPGVALAGALPLERGALARWAAGVAASPLVAAAAAWLLMRAGLGLPRAALIVAIASTIAWIATEWRAADRDRDDVREDEGRAWAWSIGAALVIGFVMFAKPFLQIRIDGWIHGGIIEEILVRGIPPEDPRFAGLKLNYVWFYNYFIALLASLRHGSPFALMAVSNVAETFATMAIAWLAGWQLWRSGRAATGAMVLMGLGFNAGAWMTWPLRFVKLFVGHQHGLSEIPRLLAHSDWGSTEILFDLGPWHGHMVNFLDKLLHGTAINVAYAFLLFALWAMLAALRGSRPALFWGALSAAGMMLFHGVVGLSVIPVTIAALALAWVCAGWWRWLPGRGRLAAFATALGAGTLVAAPYTIAISRAWPAARSGLHFSYLGFDGHQWIAIPAALAVTAWFARRAPARAIAERDGVVAVLSLWTLGMLAFAGIVLLPLGNNAKFIFEVFTGLALLAGVGFFDELAAWRRRFGPVGATALGVLLLASTPLLTLQGYLRDHAGDASAQMHPAPGEDALYQWMLRATPKDAVFVDAGYRSTIMVRAARQLLVGDTRGPEVAAFPLDELLRRRAWMADLYGPADSLDRDAGGLRRLGRPAYVLVRAADADSLPMARAHLDARPDLFAPAYDRDGFMVYHVRPTPTSGDPRP